MMQDPLAAKFQGPYAIEKKLSEVNYVVSTPDRRKSRRVCHINMLKRYHERAPTVSVGMVGQVTTPLSDDENVDCPSDSLRAEGDAVPIRLSNSEVLDNLEAELSHLTNEQRCDVRGLFYDHPSICSDTLGLTTWAVHDVDVGDSPPIKQHPYRLNPMKAAAVQKEVQYMLDHGLVEPSQSSWSSPVVLVPKPDGSQRLCVDYRKVNAVTQADSFPIPRLEDCIDLIGQAKYISTIDLLKGYWQVPLTDRAREISSFVVSDAVYASKVMSFGMKNAVATFQRLMTKVLAGLTNCKAYIDDVVVFSDTWEDHVNHLRSLFERLVEANLVVNLRKCEFGKAKVTYLGHEVGQGHVLPRQAKVQAILQFPEPTNKRELLRFLGMSGFCLLYTSPSPRDGLLSRMPSSA